MKLREIFFVLFFGLCFQVLASNAYSGELAYSRQAAVFYASHHCGTSLDTAYNHTEYIYYNGDKPECVAGSGFALLYFEQFL